MKRFLIGLCFLASIAHGQARPSVWERAIYGSIPGITVVHLVGNNGGITTTYEPIWPESGAYTPLAAAMSTPYCASSDNTNDKAGGTGCLTMTVSGVDTSYAAFSETVTLNGQTSVNLATTNVLFINRLICLTTGSAFANTGTIRCGTGSNSSGVPAVVHAHMAIGFGKSQSAMYFVPASKVLICRNWTIQTAGLTANLAVKFALDYYTDPVAAKVLQREELGIINQSATSVTTLPFIRKYAPKTLVIPQALAATSTGPVNLNAECLLIDVASANNAQTEF